MEDQLICLPNFKDTFVFVKFEILWHSDVPLGCFLSNVSDHHWFFSFELNWHKTEVKLIWEIKHGSAASGSDGNDEFLSFCNYHQVVCVVCLSFRAKFDDVADFHAWRDFGRHLVNVGGC